MKMNNSPRATGHAGGIKWNSAEKQGNKLKPVKKATGYTSDTEAIKNDIFACGKQEHAADFERVLKRVADYIRQEGDKSVC